MLVMRKEIGLLVSLLAWAFDVRIMGARVWATSSWKSAKAVDLKV